MSSKDPKVRKEKRTIKCDKTKEELIDEAMRDSEEYFQALEQHMGKQYADQVRKQHRKELEESLKDYKQGEEEEIEIVVLE